MQVCHGKALPLRRMHTGDSVVCYSPTDVQGDQRPLQAFTAQGVLCDRQPYQVEMGPDFHPWRRDVLWQPARETPIAPLLQLLDFSRGRRHWGYALRFGYFELTVHDFQLIADAMRIARQ